MSWRRRVGFAGVLMALILLLMACGGSTGTSSTLGSASATIPASGNMAPEWLVVNGPYSDQRVIDIIGPPPMMAVQNAHLSLPKRQHNAVKHPASHLYS